MATADVSEPTDTKTQIEDDLDARVSAIIRNHALYAAGAGVVPVPLVDLAATTTVQLRMVAQLCEAYEAPFSQQSVKSSIAALIAAALPRMTVGYPLMSLAKGVPVVGQVLALATLPTLNGGVTYALGKVFAWHLARGGTIESLDPSEVKEQFKEQVEAGKAAVSAATKSRKATAG